LQVVSSFVAMIHSLRSSRFFISSVVFVSFASSPVFPNSMKAGVLLHLAMFLAVSFMLCLVFIIRVTFGEETREKTKEFKVVLLINKNGSTSS